MRLVINEGQFKMLNELTGEFKTETEVIYKDNNLICLIPKTQMSSKMYGKNTSWCQISRTGFEMWSRRGLLIRFLFRGGRKIRFTYFFGDHEPAFGNNDNNDYYWANENGYHVLFGDGNPFDVRTKTERVRETELDILNHIKIIPDECKIKVLEFIKNNIKQYDYCYKNNEFHTKKEKIINDLYAKIRELNNKFYDETIKAERRNFYIRTTVDEKEFKLCIAYTFDLSSFRNGNSGTTVECFDNIDSLALRYTELLKQSRKKKPPVEGSTSGLES